MKNEKKMEIRFERMRPGELTRAARERREVWMPVGTLEWHGRHLPVGLDAIKAHALCMRIAERSGGIVMPPDFFSMGGMMFPWTFKYSPAIVARLVYGTLNQLFSYGFRTVFIITGHYPVSQVLLLMGVAEAFMAAHDAVVVALPEFAVTSNLGYDGDHAAKWETSIMMELFPDLVDEKEMSRVSGKKGFQLAQHGIHGENPAEEASRETGAEVVTAIVENFAALAASIDEKHDKRIAREQHLRAATGFLRIGFQLVFGKNISNR